MPNHRNFAAIFASVLQKRGLWGPVDPVVADPVRQDNDKRNNIQIYTEIPKLKYTEGL